MKKIKLLFVKYIYADHNSSPAVKREIKFLLDILNDENKKGLNIGAGHTKLHSNLLNLDIFPGENIDLIGKAENIPIEDNYFDIIISQETLEHVQDPFKAMKEIARVLKNGGIAYIQLPFIIGYHPGPTDYWRFSIEGIQELALRENLKIKRIGISVGGGSGYYRISVEFFAGILSIFLPFFYKIFKGFFALVLYPLKAFDLLFKYSKQKNRIAGGYYLLAEK